MKEENVSQLGDYDAPFREQQYTYGSCYISMFKFKSFDQFNNPQTASNFRHLLSCDTIEFMNPRQDIVLVTTTDSYLLAVSFLE